MAEVAAKGKRQPSPNKPNIYCLFASQKSLQQFQAYRQAKMQPKQPEPIIKTEQSSDSQISILSFKDKDPLELTPVPKVLKVYHCRKCFKELIEQQKLEGICDECIWLQKLASSANFERFIMHLLEFKAKPLISLHSSKMRRMDSIESIQSFTLDKPQDSQIRFNSPHQGNNIKNSVNLLFSMENGASPTKKTSLGDSIQSGYYCNGCATQPIVGRRFHCLTCEDYDLCEKCYFYIGHKHDMKTYKDMREEMISRTQKALRRHQSLQNTLTFLSSSIRDFEKVPKKLFKTTALKHN